MEDVKIPKFVCGWVNFILAFKGWFAWCDKDSEDNTWKNLQKIICRNNYHMSAGNPSGQVYNIIMHGVDDYNKWCIDNGNVHNMLTMRDLDDIVTSVIVWKFSHRLQIIINIGNFFANMDSAMFHFEKPEFRKGGLLKFGMKTRWMTYTEMNRIVGRYKW